MRFCTGPLLLHKEQPPNTQWCQPSFPRVWSLAGVPRLPWVRLAALCQGAGLAELDWGNSVCWVPSGLFLWPWWKGKGVTDAMSTLEPSTCIPPANIVRLCTATHVAESRGKGCNISQQRAWTEQGVKNGARISIHLPPSPFYQPVLPFKEVMCSPVPPTV